MYRFVIYTNSALQGEANHIMVLPLSPAWAVGLLADSLLSGQDSFFLDVFIQLSFFCCLLHLYIWTVGLTHLTECLPPHIANPS